MHWHELGRVRSGMVAPDFALISGSGDIVTRSQYRQRSHLALFFIPASGAATVAPVVDLLTARGASFDEASARAYAIAPQPDPANGSRLLLADPGDTARAAYADLFPEGDEPGPDEPFALVLDRYGKPWYAGHGAIDEAAVDEALTKLWAMEYDCPE
ncbi:MAG: hypothetical protein IT325_12495 [Anaerolineae bacterium]|nr:hypothetical protein [Anaerolineae bacterium]